CDAVSRSWHFCLLRVAPPSMLWPPPSRGGPPARPQAAPTIGATRGGPAGGGREARGGGAVGFGPVGGGGGEGWQGAGGGGREGGKQQGGEAAESGPGESRRGGQQCAGGFVRESHGGPSPGDGHGKSVTTPMLPPRRPSKTSSVELRVHLLSPATGPG